jgi:hypothetical protein
MPGFMLHIFSSVSLLSALTVFLLPARVLSQPSFSPDTTPQLPICDYSVVRGAQNELDKLINDYKLKQENEIIWGTKIDLMEITLVGDAGRYYGCDLHNLLKKPFIIRKPYTPYIPYYPRFR